MKDFLLYHGDGVRFVLDEPDLRAELDLYCASLYLTNYDYTLTNGRKKPSGNNSQPADV
jgi:hypothetical protein